MSLSLYPNNKLLIAFSTAKVFHSPHCPQAHLGSTPARGGDFCGCTHGGGLKVRLHLHQQRGWKDALGDLPTATLPPDLGLLQRPCLARLGIPTSSRACPYSEITSLQVRSYWSVGGLIQCDPFPPKKKTPCDEADAQCPVQGHHCRPRSAEDCELEARTRRERRPRVPQAARSRLCLDFGLQRPDERANFCCLTHPVRGASCKSSPEKGIF